MSSLSDQLFQEILLACQRVYTVSDVTPLEIMAAPEIPFQLFLKREDLGPIKAYKWRGAYNRMALLSEQERARGVVTASAGNHAQGVALAARRLGINARIFMPRPTPRVKRDAVRRFGGEYVEIVLHGDSYDAASEAAFTDARVGGRAFVHPYDDLCVMGGQGTLAVEIARAAKIPFDAAVLQIGGGGMAAGVACWLKRQYPGIRIFGVEGEDQACMGAAHAAGSPVLLEQVDIFCDGTAVKKAGSLTFQLCEELVDEYVTVSNNEVCHAMQSIWDANRIVTETSGALGVAGALKLGQALRGQNVLSIISGANIDFGMLGYISRNTNIGGVSRRHLRVRIAETPGSLLRLLETVFEGCDIVEFQYGKTHPGEAQFIIGVATDDAAMSALHRKLTENEIPWEDVTGQDDVRFRVIRYEDALLANPVFLSLDFYERPGALHDFLKEHVAAHGNICYFNYTYTGERIGRALLGIEFADQLTRTRFIETLPVRGVGFRHCRLVTGPAETRLHRPCCGESTAVAASL
ncbi:MAG: pyridoxal-phosphate dependent enzyme [Puniceicoccales bacterium]|jgi:threonine dehydratase|nr:pyridoxal-phosphate dependent enzyme [Puniceicoccales bacterium]